MLHRTGTESAAAVTPSGTLPYTGGSTTGGVPMALVLLAAGAALTALGALRRRGH